MITLVVISFLLGTSTFVALSCGKKQANANASNGEGEGGMGRGTGQDEDTTNANSSENGTVKNANAESGEPSTSHLATKSSVGTSPHDGTGKDELRTSEFSAEKCETDQELKVKIDGSTSPGTQNEKLIKSLCDESLLKKITDWYDKCKFTETAEKSVPNRDEVQNVLSNIDNETRSIQNVVKNMDQTIFLDGFKLLQDNSMIFKRVGTDTNEIRLQLLMRMCFLSTIQECIEKGLWFVFLQQGINELYRKVARVLLNMLHNNWFISKPNDEKELPRYLCVEIRILKRLLEKKMTAEKPTMPSSLSTYHITGMYSHIFWTAIFNNFDEMIENFIEQTTTLSPPHAKLALLKRHDDGQGYAGIGTTKLIDAVASLKSIKLEQYIDMFVQIWSLDGIFSKEK